MIMLNITCLIMMHWVVVVKRCIVGRKQAVVPCLLCAQPTVCPDIRDG